MHPLLPVHGKGLTEPDNITDLLSVGGSCGIKQKLAVFVFTHINGLKFIKSYSWFFLL
jgi:hypothetical protein